MNCGFDMKKTALVLCAVVAAGCQGAMNSPVSPSAVSGGASALNADGSNLKATPPLAISPVFEATAISSTPTLAARAGAGRYERAALSQRFQVADSDAFTNILATGMGSTDASGITRYTVDPAIAANKRVVWRVRAEMGDAVGPWSNMMAFTTAGSVATTVPSGTFGNAGRNILRGPGWMTFDLSIQRRFEISRANATLRADIFNVFNRANFGLPGANIAAPATVGVISSLAGDPRVMQISLRIGF